MVAGKGVRVVLPNPHEQKDPNTCAGSMCTNGYKYVSTLVSTNF